MPTDEPALAGFVKRGKPSAAATSASTRLGSALKASSRIVRKLVTGTAASRSSLFITSLSIPMAEPNTPAPTYGMPATSNRPCRAPSSPKVPCSTGKTTSILPGPPITLCVEPAGREGSCTGNPGSTRTSRGSRSLARSFSGSCLSQRPALSMPISTGSKRDRSSAASTLRADKMEISCSADWPPKRIPTRIFSLDDMHPRYYLTRAGSPRDPGACAKWSYPLGGRVAAKRRC